MYSVLSKYVATTYKHSNGTKSGKIHNQNAKGKSAFSCSNHSTSTHTLTAHTWLLSTKHMCTAAVLRRNHIFSFDTKKRKKRKEKSNEIYRRELSVSFGILNNCNPKKKKKMYSVCRNPYLFALTISKSSLHILICIKWN